jgi:hypothetical protein
MPAAFCPTVAALLAHERTLVPQTAIVRARALVRARAALRAGDAVLFAPARLPLPGRRLLLAAAASVALLASGALAFELAWPRSSAPATRVYRPQATRHAQVASPVPAMPPAPLPAPKAAPARIPTMPGSVPAKVAGAGLPVSPGENDDASGELRLLERALTLNARGEHAAVLALTADHERRYPAGRLCEEREVLQLRALLGLGRGNEARRGVAGFRRNFPHSVLLPKLDDMLATSR